MSRISAVPPPSTLAIATFSARNAEGDFRTLAENMPDRVARYDRQGRAVYFNSVLRRALGRDAEAMLGRTVRERYPDGSFEAYAAALDEVLATGKGREIELTVPEAHGTRIYQIRFVPESDADGQMDMVLAIGTDITEFRRFAREAMLLNGAMDKSSDAAFLMDAQGRFVYVNESACRSLGYRRDELLGLTPVDIDPHMSHERLRRRMQRAFATMSALDTWESEHIARDGRRFPVEVTGSPVALDGAPYLLSMVRNISERKAAEAKLHASEQAFRAMVENSPDLISRYDREGRRLYVNPAFERVALRLQESLHGALLGNTPLKASVLADPTHFMQLLARVVASGREIIEEEMICDSQGKTRWAHLRLVPEFDKEGRVASVLSVGRNITALKQAEQKLRTSYGLLQELTSRRETAREEERKRIAREIHDELGQHLTGLRLNLGLLRAQFGALHPELQSRLSELLAATDETLQVARNISALLRPAALELGIVPALHWLAEEFRRNTGLPCAVACPPAEPELREDHAVALFRVAQESLTNVARHAGARQARIVLERRGGRYLMEIADDGIGFEVDAQRPQKFGLVGIRERMLAVGGEATVESAPGQGTRIRVTLPARATAG